MTNATPAALQSRLRRAYPALTVTVCHAAAAITVADDASREGSFEDALIASFSSPAGHFSEVIPLDQTVAEAVALLKSYADDLAFDTAA
jgi:hypothetical protein